MGFLGLTKAVASIRNSDQLQVFQCMTDLHINGKTHDTFIKIP